MPSVSPWYAGAVVPLAWVNTDVDNNPQDAASLSSVSVTVTLPDRTTATPAVTRVGQGSYTAQFTSTEPGHHVILWQSTDSTYPGAYADSFEVQAAADPTIVSLLEAKEILRLTGTTSDDQILHGYNAAATQVAEHFCGAVVTRQRTEVVRASGRALLLSHTPVRTDLGTTIDATYQRDGSTTNGLVSITPLLSYGFMYDLDQLLVDPETGIVRHAAGFPFFYTADYLAQYKAVYWAGRKVIDPAIYEGAKIILEHLWQVKRGGLGSSAVLAPGQDTTVVPGFGFAIPNRALQLFGTVTGSKAAFA